MWRYILKATNFLIFRHFSIFFLGFSNFFYFLLRVDVTANMAQTKKHRHVATYETAMCQTRVFMCSCVSARVCTCVRVCARVFACVYVIKEKAPCYGFSLTPKSRTPFICIKIYFKSHVGLCFLVLSAQVTWRYKEHLIHALKEDCRSSLTTGVCGTILFVGESFFKRVNLSC